MIKRTNSIFKLCILLIIILFGSCKSPKEVSAWDVVDSNSVVILESKNIPELPDKLFEQFFKRSDLYLSSVQKSSTDDFDIFYSYVLKKDIYDSILISKSWFNDQKISSHLFNGFEIYEIKNISNENQLTFAYLGGIFVLSKSSILIENAIRIFQNQETRGFKIKNKELFQFPSLKSDQGNVYVNISKFSEFPFTDSSLLKSVPLLNELRNLSIYDIKSTEGFLSLSGFSIGENSNLKLFQKQRPVTFEVAKYIPNYTSGLVHFGISDFHSITNGIDSSFLKKFEVGNEIAFISVKNNENLVAFVEFNTGLTQDFDFITNYNETYSNYQIRSVNGEVLKKGFKNIFPAVPFTFCTIKDNYLFLSQSVDELKSLLDAIENDDTWGKTLDYQKFSEHGLQESNVTIIFKEPDFFSKVNGVLRSYPGLIDSLGLDKINWSSMQMSALDNHFYSTVNFSYGSTSLRLSELKRNAKSSFIELPGAPQFYSLVRNHNTGAQEILVQSSDLMIYLISLKEGIIWKRQIDSQIQGTLEQLDYFKNEKLQYFFSSKKKLYIIDRLGRDVVGFPKPLSSSTRFSDLVDYDKSKNYRFVISSVSNEIYLFDKKGNNLNDWGPKKFEKEITCSPQHFKIGGKDHFIVLLDDGTVQIFNRKGDPVNLFKTKNTEIFSGDFYIESGTSTSETYLHYVSSDGAITRQSLSGVIISTDNLLRGKNSKFVLKRVVNSEEFYVYRIDTDKIVVFNKQGKIVFEVQNSGSTNLEFQCIEVGNDKMVFSFYDVEQNLAQVFDKSGNSLTKAPIESDIVPLIGFGNSKSEVVIYSISQNSIILTSIRY